MDGPRGPGPEEVAVHTTAGEATDGAPATPMVALNPARGPSSRKRQWAATAMGKEEETAEGQKRQKDSAVVEPRTKRRTARPKATAVGKAEPKKPRKEDSVVKPASFFDRYRSPATGGGEVCGEHID